MRHLINVLIASGALFLFGIAGFAQAPPGPLQPPPESQNSAAPQPVPEKTVQVKPRKNILGAWKLNRDESDDAHKKLQQARQNEGGGNRGGYGGRPRVGVGWPGAGGGGMGGRRGGAQNDTDENSQKSRELFNPASQVTLAQKIEQGPELDLTDDQNRKRVFFTDGRKLQKPKDDSYEEIAAHWQGTELVTDEKGPRGGKMSRSFELSSDGTQLWETVHFTLGRSGNPVSIRYVYDAIDSEQGKQASNQPEAHR